LSDRLYGSSRLKFCLVEGWVPWWRKGYVVCLLVLECELAPAHVQVGITTQRDFTLRELSMEHISIDTSQRLASTDMTLDMPQAYARGKQGQLTH